MKDNTVSIIRQSKIQLTTAATFAALCLAASNPALAEPPPAPSATGVQTANVTPSSVVAPSPQSPNQPPTFLAWEADSKKFDAQPGELMAHFTFYVTNVSAQVVVITNLQRSCGCTEATMPAQPWSLAPGTNGPIHATIDLRGKLGTVSKLLTVNSSAGAKVLTLNVTIPASTNLNPGAGANPSSLMPAKPSANLNRAANQQASAQDRQAVFKGECASCHAEPTIGKLGHELYQAGCAICHDAAHRAPMVPDLRALKPALNPEQWRQWITFSKPGSMMPAFAKAHGGPLSDEQIGSLVEYLAGAMGNSKVGAVLDPKS